MHNDDSELLQLVTRTYGPLLSQKQLAELLKRSLPGLRYSLHCAADTKIKALKACSKRVGRRVYYPAPEVARIIAGGDPT